MAWRGVLIAVVVCIVACTQNQAPVASTAKPSSQIVYMRMTSLDVMWAETSNGTYRSTDHGVHWSNVTPAAATNGNLFALDDQAAWVVSSDLSSQTYTVFRTTDGGHTWSKSSGTVARGRFGDVTFIDRQHGWSTVSLGAAAGSEGVAILRSADGGVTWTKVAESADPASTDAGNGPSGIAFGCDKGSAVFGSPTVGLLPVECAGGPPFLYRTLDGGVHWTVVALPNLSQESFFDNATFLTASQVVMVGRYFPTSYTMLRSQDAGATWTALSLPGTGPVDFGSPTSAWQLGEPIRETTDGGVSWHAVPAPALPFKTDQMSLQYLGKGIAVVWSFAAAYRTDDSGRTWRTVIPT